jgi:hypothetical protein
MASAYRHAAGRPAPMTWGDRMMNCGMMKTSFHQFMAGYGFAAMRKHRQR